MKLHGLCFVINGEFILKTAFCSAVVPYFPFQMSCNPRIKLLQAEGL